MFTGLGTRWVIMVTRSRMVTEYYFTWGGHALTSPKGGRPCSLGTLNHIVAGIWLTDKPSMVQKGSGGRHQSTIGPE